MPGYEEADIAFAISMINLKNATNPNAAIAKVKIGHTITSTIPMLPT